MKAIATLRKLTKTGVSVWHFCIDSETDQFYAVGGENLKVLPANDRKHLRLIYNNFKRYGYAEKLTSKKQYISDPWDSELPADLQQELELLPA